MIKFNHKYKALLIATQNMNDNTNNDIIEDINNFDVFNDEIPARPIVDPEYHNSGVPIDYSNTSLYKIIYKIMTFNIQEPSSYFYHKNVSKTVELISTFNLPIIINNDMKPLDYKVIHLGWFLKKGNIYDLKKSLIEMNAISCYSSIRIKDITEGLIICKSLLCEQNIIIHVINRTKVNRSIMKWLFWNKYACLRSTTKKNYRIDYPFKQYRLFRQKLHEELIQYHYHPEKINKWINDGNNIENYLN